MKLLALFTSFIVAAAAQADEIPTFYRCGKVLSDRPMPECADAVIRESDIQTKRAEAYERQRRHEFAQDLWLARRFPDPAAFKRARAEDVAKAEQRLSAAHSRLELVRVERKILSECRASASGAADRSLQAQIDSNAAQLEVFAAIEESTRNDISRINTYYDDTYPKLRESWRKAAQLRDL